MSLFSRHVCISVSVLTVVLTSLFALVTANDHTVNTGADIPYKFKKPSSEELQKIIQLHAEWLLEYKDAYESDVARNDMRRANLSGADLRSAKLIKVNLGGADLSNAKLGDADLCEAELRRANLCGAELSNAKLRGTDLSGAELWSADLSGSDLEGANLKNAKLNGAVLSNARLFWGADLSDTDLRDANLDGVVFEPTTLPKPVYIAFAENLEKMVYDSTPQELIKLRNAFRDSGFLGKEREITYAIKHCERKKALVSGKYDLAAFESVFNWIFFEFTTQWGLSPWRALKFLLYLILIFTIPYAIALYRPGDYGIYRMWSDESMMPDTGIGMPKPDENMMPDTGIGKPKPDESMMPNTGIGKPKLMQVGLRQAVNLGLFFSMLSAFSIGWRELNVGNWIQRLQPKDYSLRATGWVRTVSGVQSLVSVYLLAIWALTFFGHPFE